MEVRVFLKQTTIRNPTLGEAGIRVYVYQKDTIANIQLGTK